MLCSSSITEGPAIASEIMIFCDSFSEFTDIVFIGCICWDGLAEEITCLDDCVRCDFCVSCDFCPSLGYHL